MQPHEPNGNFLIEWSEDSFTVRFSGTLTVSLTLRANDEWVSQPRYDDCAFFVLDFRGVDTVDFSESDLKLNAHYSRRVSQWGFQRTRYVGFVIRAEHTESFARFIAMAEETGGNWVRKIFTDEAAAQTWARQQCESRS